MVAEEIKLLYKYILKHNMELHSVKYMENQSETVQIIFKINDIWHPFQIIALQPGVKDDRNVLGAIRGQQNGV